MPRFDSFINALFPALDEAADGRARAASLVHVLLAFLNLFRNQIHAAMCLRRKVISQLMPGFWSEKDSDDCTDSRARDEIKESFIGGHDEALLPAVEFLRDYAACSMSRSRLCASLIRVY